MNTHTHIYIYIYVIHIYAHIYIYMHICIYTYIPLRLYDLQAQQISDWIGGPQVLTSFMFL